MLSGHLNVFESKAQAAEYKFNMSYIFFSDSSNYTAMVDSAQIL